MDIGTIGQAMTAEQVNQISGDFVRFGIALKDAQLPKDFENFVEIVINDEPHYIGMTGIYEIDHPITINSISVNSSLDEEFYLDYVIQGEEL